MIKKNQMEHTKMPRGKIARGTAIGVALALICAAIEAHADKGSTSKTENPPVRDQSKLNDLEKVAQLEKQIIGLAERTRYKTVSSSIDAPEYKDVDRIVDSVTDIDQLVKLAAVCRVMCYPMDAKDVYVDNYFDRAFWHCLRRLAHFPRVESHNAFLELENSIAPLRGSDKDLFEKISSAK